MTEKNEITLVRFVTKLVPKFFERVLLLSYHYQKQKVVGRCRCYDSLSECQRRRKPKVAKASKVAGKSTNEHEMH